MNFEERYLGDGVYASNVGGMIVLDLRGQKEYDGHETKIGLEPEVMQKLKKYEHDLIDFYRKVEQLRSHQDPDDPRRTSEGPKDAR